MRRLWIVPLVLACLGLAVSITQAERKEITPYHPVLPVKVYEWYVKSKGFSPHELSVHSIGQSHIDAAWKWRLEQTHDKVYKTFSKAIEHIQEYPDFTFSGSTPLYYEWIMEEHPDLFKKIQEREKQGRWEIVGGQWVEPDGNMPSGESFVRQRLLGQRFYLEHFGHISKVSWMLDSFGYNFNLPQIMARSGAKYMWTSKLTWNDTTKFPFHNFWWESPDGSQVLTHICPISPFPMYFSFGEVGTYKDTRYLLKPDSDLVANYATPQQTIRETLSRDWLDEIGVFYGLGDGGHGPLKYEIKVQKALAQKGYTEFSTGLELFQDIEACGDRLPVWKDEMYLEYHRGVLTTQAWIKRANRKAERALGTAETLRTVLHNFNVTYPYEQLKEVWKLVLLNQFHDILPGSSIPEVYQDAKEHYDRIFNALHNITYGGMDRLAGLVTVSPPEDHMDGIVVFNSLPWERSGPVEVRIPSQKHWRVIDKSGMEVAFEEVEKEEGRFLVFRAEEVPSVGYKVYYVEKPEKPETGLPAGPTVTGTAEAFVLENSLVKVSVNKESGLITSLVNKETGEEFIDGPSNKLLAFWDKPKQWSAWNINENYLDHPIPIEAPSEVKISRDGPLFSEVLVRSKAKMKGMEPTTFVQRIRLMKNDPVVYLDVDSDFHMHDALVKVEFNSTLHSDTVVADNAYLPVARPTHPQTPAEKARWEMPCQKWIDISEPDRGLALLNKGKYGFSLNPDGTGYRLSLIKGAHHPRAAPEAKNVKRHILTPQTTLTDQGHHHVEMGLLAHRDHWKEKALWQDGYNFNTPLEARWSGAHEGSLPEEGSFLSVDAENVYIGSVKRAEDDGDMVIRLVEAAGKETSATITLGQGFNLVSAARTDLLELHPEKLTASGSSLTVNVKPYEIITLKLKLSRRQTKL
ncbi:MAG: glycoside hydrolase family 38 C-terminal domain-containing protein [bacterium]